MGAALVVVGGRISTSRGFGERQEDWIASIGFALIMASLIRHESNRPIVSRSVVLDWLAEGHEVAVVPVQAEVTTQEAARIMRAAGRGGRGVCNVIAT